MPIMFAQKVNDWTYDDPKALSNKRLELISKCRHESKHMWLWYKRLKHNVRTLYVCRYVCIYIYIHVCMQWNLSCFHSTCNFDKCSHNPHKSLFWEERKKKVVAKFHNMDNYFKNYVATHFIHYIYIIKIILK